MKWLRLKNRDAEEMLEKDFQSEDYQYLEQITNSIVNARCLFKTRIDNLFGDAKCLTDAADELISKI